jgi:hypothetical protein
MTPEQMKSESIRIVQRFEDRKVSNGEGMVILAMTLAQTFKTNGVSKFEAINRFVTIVNQVYGE